MGKFPGLCRSIIRSPSTGRSALVARRLRLIRMVLGRNEGANTYSVDFVKPVHVQLAHETRELEPVKVFVQKKRVKSDKLR